MKRGFKKSLALLLAVFMTFGAVPFFAVGLVTFAEDANHPGYTLKSISITPEIVGVDDEFIVGDSKELQVSGAYQNDTDSDDIQSWAIAASSLEWSTSDSGRVTVSNDGIITAVAITKANEPVIITALDKTNVKIAECKVTVTKAPVYVDTILWDWDMTAVLAEKEYSFDNRYKLVPDKDKVDDASVTLTCAPESALQIDNENQKFKVNPITEDKLVITLTLTANGAGEKCQPATKQVTVYKDVPLTSIEWDYKVGSTGKSLFKYYETVSGLKQPAEYYYEYLENKETKYKYHTDPAYAKDLCEIKVTSADKRIVTFDEQTKRLIPVGNGEAQITITAKTPKGVTKSHTIIAVVQESPYTPVTSVAIGYDKDKTDSDADYDSASNTLKLMYTHSIQLTANVNSGAKLDHEPITLTMSDGRKVAIVSGCDHTWKSSDESVATVDKDGKVTVTGAGTATITLTVNDNGKTITKEVKVQGKMVWWEALAGIFMSLFGGRWNKIPVYFKALFSSLF